MPNLIVIIFNLLYAVYIVGFHCKGYVIERVVWRLKHLGIEEGFAGILRLSIPRSISCALYVLECEESGQMETTMSREYLAGKAFSRDILFCQPVQSDTHFLCLHYLYPYYPQMKGELLRENPSQTPWELEIVILTILYTFVLRISSSFTSPFPYHWEVDSPNTCYTL